MPVAEGDAIGNGGIARGVGLQVPSNDDWDLSELGCKVKQIRKNIILGRQKGQMVGFSTHWQ